MAIFEKTKSLLSNFKPSFESLSEMADREYANSLLDDFDGISSVKEALKEIPVGTDPYLSFHRYVDGDVVGVHESLNSRGILESSLPFYQKYMTSTFVTTLFRKKVAKVVGEVSNEILRAFALEFFVYGKFYVFEKIDESGEVDYKILPYHKVHETEDDFQVIDLVTEYLLKVTEFSKSGGSYASYFYDFSNEKKVIVTFSERGVLKKTPIVKVDSGRSDMRNIKDTLLAIAVTESVSFEEVEGLQRSIHADEGYFRRSGFQKKRHYRIYSSASDIGETSPLFKIVNEPLKDYSGILEYLKKSLANEIGLSLSFLGIDKANDVTATEVNSNDEESLYTINEAKRELQEAFNYVMSLFNPSFKTVELQALDTYDRNRDAEYVKSIESMISARKRIELLFPALKDDQIDKETILYKFENGIPLTAEEEKKQIELNVFGAGEDQSTDSIDVFEP